MNKFIQLIIVATLAFVISSKVHAQQSGDFVVEAIEIAGLAKIAPTTVLAFVSFEKGDEIDQEVLEATVSRLFETGLFRDVTIEREEQKVIIRIIESPTISSIRFEGLFDVDSDDVIELLRSQDIGVGRVYKRGDKEFIERTVQSFYRSNSRFLAKTTVIPVPIEGNRLDLVIEVVEGAEVLIGQININGNQALNDSEILDLFELKSSGIIDSYLERDVFNQSTLDADLSRLRREYLNAGYVRFDVISTDVKVQVEGEGIIIDIFVAEGPQFKFGDTNFVGNTSKANLEQVVAEEIYQKGQVYSVKKTDSFRESLERLLRLHGYAFAKVETRTRINDIDLSVDVEFDLRSDSIVEVRNIRFIGNNLTQDLVLRRQLEIVEGEIYDLEKLDYSLTRLRRSGYLRTVRAIEHRIGQDQVDIDIEVTEQSQGRFIIGAGYSNSGGVSFSLGFSRNNIGGTGNDLSLDLKFFDDNKHVELDFREPGITDLGITRNLALYVIDSSSDSKSISLNDISSYGSRLSYNIPIDREWSWDIGLLVEQIKIENAQSISALPKTPDENQSIAYIDRYGDTQDALRLIAGIGYDSRDRSFNTTEGLKFSVSTEVSVPPSDVKYFQVRTDSSYFIPLEEKRENILNARFSMIYGDKVGDNIYPYYKRIYLANSQLRGFKANRLGSQNQAGTAIGGLITASSSVEIERKVDLFGIEGMRVGVFVDAAGIWDKSEGNHVKNNGIRSSTGLLFRIRTPIFPLLFTYGVPIHNSVQDELQRFQFSVGIQE